MKSENPPSHVVFNLNDTVRFKLTPVGLAIHRQNWDELNAKLGGRLCACSRYEPPKVDKDGYTSEQMWRVMQEYGAHLYNGGNPPFSMNFQLVTEYLTDTKGERLWKTQ